MLPMPDRQTTEYSATQLVYSIKLKLSHTTVANTILMSNSNNSGRMGLTDHTPETVTDTKAPAVLKIVGLAT